MRGSYLEPHPAFESFLSRAWGEGWGNKRKERDWVGVMPLSLRAFPEPSAGAQARRTDAARGEGDCCKQVVLAAW